MSIVLENTLSSEQNYTGTKKFRQFRRVGNRLYSAFEFNLIRCSHTRKRCNHSDLADWL